MSPEAVHQDVEKSSRLLGISAFARNGEQAEHRSADILGAGVRADLSGGERRLSFASSTSDPVFRNYVEFPFDGRLLRQHNHFFTLRTEPFEISTAGFDAQEQRTHLTHRWWNLEELRTTNETFFPEELPDLLS